MKPGIHPEYYQVEATCVCGNVISTGSTRQVLKMDICSACHPFFTGTQKIIDTEGRVEKFKKRYTQAEAMRVSNKSKSKDRKAEEEVGQSDAPAQNEPEVTPEEQPD